MYDGKVSTVMVNNSTKTNTASHLKPLKHKKYALEI